MCSSTYTIPELFSFFSSAHFLVNWFKLSVFTSVYILILMKFVFSFIFTNIAQGSVSTKMAGRNVLQWANFYFLSFSTFESLYFFSFTWMKKLSEYSPPLLTSVYNYIFIKIIYLHKKSFKTDNRRWLVYAITHYSDLHSLLLNWSLSQWQVGHTLTLTLCISVCSISNLKPTPCVVYAFGITFSRKGLLLYYDSSSDLRLAWFHGICGF